jgi:predicted nucleic acid-binding protein
VLLDILTEDQHWSDWSASAHAAVAGLDLLTRDIGRYHTYFPTVRLITPSS